MEQHPSVDQSSPPVGIFGIWLSENDYSILSAEIDRLARITPILEERAKKLPKYNFLAGEPIEEIAPLYIKKAEAFVEANSLCRVSIQENAIRDWDGRYPNVYADVS
ncbi:hypothetical protein LENED_005742 [Lentinula edodes]|uniref:Uncharacterized protein n=1 Tax=Lentinula edodes TaxID=5353 RepID=A0A1Q3E9U5_LENED|nr:hypothetical protein LENED_005742 [Lentinula edodes]